MRGIIYTGMVIGLGVFGLPMLQLMDDAGVPKLVSIWLYLMLATALSWHIARKYVSGKNW